PDEAAGGSEAHEQAVRLRAPGAAPQAPAVQDLRISATPPPASQPAPDFPAEQTSGLPASAAVDLGLAPTQTLPRPWGAGREGGAGTAEWALDSVFADPDWINW